MYLLYVKSRKWKLSKESSHPLSKSQLWDEIEHHTCLDGESKAVELGREDSLLCNEIIDSYAMFGNINPNNAPSTKVAHNIINARQRDDVPTCRIFDLENLEHDTPPDFLTADL